MADPQAPPQADAATGERHYDDAVAIAAPTWHFAGGAQSFSDYDSWLRAAEQEGEVLQLSSTFDGIVSNIMADPDLTLAGKAQAVGSAANEMAVRVAASDVGERAYGRTPGGFAVMRDKATGDLRWLAVYSNHYEDREGEIFSGASHEEFLADVKAGADFPTLRLFHVPIDIGRADALDYADGFMVASGTFAKEYADVAESLASAKDLACSHGYSYAPSDLRDGVYHRYRTFEITALPAWAAANELTSFGAGEERTMPLTGDVRSFFVEHMGEERVAAVESELAVMGARATDQGIAFKDVLAAVAPPTAAAPVAPVAPVAMTPAAPASASTPAATAEPATPAAEGEPASAPAVASEPAAATTEPTEPAPAAEPAAPTEPAADAEPVPVPNAEEATRALQGMIQAAVGAAIQPVAAAVGELGEKVAGLERTDAEKVAALWAPKVGPATGTPASADPATVIGPDEAAKMNAALADGDGEKAATPVSGYMNDMRGVLSGSVATNGRGS